MVATDDGDVSTSRRGTEGEPKPGKPGKGGNKAEKVVLPEIVDDSVRLDTKSDIWVNVILLSIAVTYAVRAITSYGPEARLMPLAAAIPVILLLGNVLINASKALKISLVERESMDPVVREQQDAAKRLNAKNTVLSYSWVVIAMVVPMAVGFLLGYPPVLLAYLRLQAKESWLYSIIYTVLFSAFIYWLFLSYVGVRAYEGLFDVPSRLGLG